VDALTALQWPAMVVTITATWLVGSTREGRRKAGFWLFLLSNAMWVAWGLHDGAPALVALQFALAAMNIRGARKAAAESRAIAGSAAASPAAASR